MSATTSLVTSKAKSATASAVPNLPISVALSATAPMSVASPATAVTSDEIPATVVTLALIPATVVTLELLLATVVIAFVAVVPSCISASKAISEVTEAIAVASV